MELLLNQAEVACDKLLQSCPTTDTALLTTTEDLRSWLRSRGIAQSELSKSVRISQSDLSLYLHDKLRPEKAQHISSTVLAFMETYDLHRASMVANPAGHSPLSECKATPAEPAAKRQ